MRELVQTIDMLATENEPLRRVVHTARQKQLVAMVLEPGEDSGAEDHKFNQLVRVQEGDGESILGGVRTVIGAGSAVLVPAGTKHSIINTGHVSLKLYTLYAPGGHRDSIVRYTRLKAETDSGHSDGKAAASPQARPRGQE